MAKIQQMLRLEKLLTDVTELTTFPVFGIDIGKDEADNNDAFFIYYDKGPIRKDETGNFQRDFVLMFVSKAGDEIDEFALIEQSPKWGLRFRETEYDYGKIGDTQQIVNTTTFYMHQVVKICK